MRKVLALTAVAALLAVSGANCLPPFDPGGNGGTRVAALRAFGSPEELRQYFVDQVVARNPGVSGSVPFFWFLTGGAAPMASDSNTGGMGAGDGMNQETGGSADGDDRSFSTTNIQEEGVDESDIVKNDGDRIYVLDGSRIHIVQANPASGLAELATVTIQDSGDSLYLAGDRLVALSRRYGWWGYQWEDGGGGAIEPMPASVQTASDVAVGPSNEGPRVTVTIINVANPAAPAVEATLHFEGEMASSRLIGSRLHLVLTATPQPVAYSSLATLDDVPLEDWIPDYQLVKPDGSSVSGDVATWQDFYRPENPDGYGVTSVVTLDVSTPTEPFRTTSISASAGTIYASTAALYVTDTRYDYTLNSSRTDTAVHKLKFTDAGTVYVGSGLVPGRLLSQYSLGEYEDYLRVATTVEQSNFSTDVFPMVQSTESRRDNNVYVLGESSGALAVVGKVEGIAPGEQIYAARFIGQRGFLVTFRRVDPLFTLDLADPTQPKIVGELKVPGYSDHIQLLDENHLLTIGKDAKEDGEWAWVQGVQLSIFDVTDAANPTLLHRETIGGRGTSSEANSNPKAFNYYKVRNALAFPVDLYGGGTGTWDWGTHEFTGLYVYRVTVAGGFQFLGRIASTQGLSPRGCYYGYYGFTRGVFMDDTVYSVTQRGVKAALIDDVATLIGQVTFPTGPAPVENCFMGAPDIVLPGGGGLR